MQPRSDPHELNGPQTEDASSKPRQWRGAHVGIMVVATALSVWLVEQSPPSTVGRFVTHHEDLLYPYAGTAAMILGHALWLIYPFALLQFPTYAAVLLWAWRRRRLLLATILVVAAHAAAFWIQSEMKAGHLSFMRLAH